VINSDITEKKEIETKFLRTQRMENIGALAGGIAHDLNNVLSPIQMGAELGMHMSVDENFRSVLQTMHAAALRGAALVKQILSFARGGEGGKSAINLSSTISEVENFARTTFPRTIRFETQDQRDLPAIHADATQLHQILLNLCVNARDAMPQGGMISVNASLVELTAHQTPIQPKPLSGQYIRVAVTDSGSGIDPEVLPRIFDAFFTTKEVGKGTGLGLSTVATIVKAHGGALDVKSKVGVGTTFEIFLPVVKGSTTAAQASASSRPTQGNGEQLLLVDDEAAILELSSTILSAYNYRILSAADGEHALALFREHHSSIDLVVSDMMMPGMSGADLISAIRGIKPEIKILAVSGLEGEQSSSQGPAERLSGFLQKPYTGTALLTSVAKVLQRR
jgi:nitrogen-specific signal transduction histidine kinase